jgi:cyclopropane fatty-acyl-phospholipid synthase-like methyltransferase
MTYVDKNPIIRWLLWKRLKMVLSLSKNNSSKKVLDFGCGEGVFLPTLDANYKNMHAVALTSSRLYCIFHIC